MNKSESINNLASALCAVQAELESVYKEATNPYFKSKYATLGQVWDSVREPLTKNNLCVVQTMDIGDGSGVIIETSLIHTSGEFISGKLFMPCTKFDAQGVGSAISYGRRYALAAMVGLSYCDDDAEGTMGREARKEERKELKKEMVESQKKLAEKVPEGTFPKPPPVADMGTIDDLPFTKDVSKVIKGIKDIMHKAIDLEEPGAEQSKDLTKALDYLQRLGYSTRGIKDAGEAWMLVESGLKTGRRWGVWKECQKLADDNQLNDLVVADIMDALGVETDKGGKPKGMGLLELHRVLEGMNKSLCRYANGKIMWETPPQEEPGEL